MMTKKVGFRALVALLCGAGFSAACSGAGTVNIGNTNVVGAQLSDYVASWDGYAEAYTFTPDGSDRVRLTITASGQGTFQVGNAALLPAPTDPNVGYPPGQPDFSTGPNTGLSGGVLYPLSAARVQESRIQAGLKPNDFYGAWCALQTPYYDLDGYMGSGGLPDAGRGFAGADGGFGGLGGSWVPIFGYFCVPGTGGGSTGIGADEQCTVQIISTDGGTSNQPVDCGKFVLCTQNVCACTATSCGVVPVVAAGAVPSGYPVELDAALDSTGKMLTGTLALSTDLRVTVVLQKQ
jgi:hypothetical protein